MAENLVALHALRDLLELLIWTGQLADERPASAIVIAPAGAGKTSLLEMLECETACFASDLTARNLASIVRQKQDMTHILLGDFLSVFGHRESTVKLTLRRLSQLTGEKMTESPDTGEAIQPRQCGLITAIPPEDAIHYARHIRGGGFASRFLIVRYSYKPSTVAEIHRFIATNAYSKTKSTPLHIERGRIVVEIPRAISDLVKDFSQVLQSNEKSDPLGFRVHRHMRALVKAAARRENRARVEARHFELVKSHCDFFSASGKDI